MPVRFICLHGHYLELTSRDLPASVVCPVCGCVNELERKFDSSEAGSREVTQAFLGGSAAESGPAPDSPALGSSRLDTPTEFFDETVADSIRRSGHMIALTLPSDANIVLPPNDHDAEAKAKVGGPRRGQNYQELSHVSPTCAPRASFDPCRGGTRTAIAAFLRRESASCCGTGSHLRACAHDPRTRRGRRTVRLARGRTTSCRWADSSSGHREL